MTEIAKIISGGQTGADRGGLDAAIELGIPHGSWCPKERRAEDGEGQKGVMTPFFVPFALARKVNGIFAIRCCANVSLL